ncbi:MAG: sugar phosphate isomerase/epimerase [Victivallales bacterium]|nr:sugar phosphate isomerase/epimerase [Victivallales bacterium]
MLKSLSFWSIPEKDGKPVRPVDAMHIVKDAGYDALELAVGLSGYLTPDTSHADCSRFQTEAARIGVQLQSIASGMTWECSPTHLDADVRARAIDLNKRALDRVAWIGAQSYLFVPGAVTIPWDANYKQVPYDQAVKWAHEAVEILGEYAANLGVELCVENVWNGMFYSPLELRDFLDSFQNPSIGSYFDAGNLLGLHQCPAHWIALLGKRIRRVHIKDYKTSVGGLAGFVNLLEGDMPWKETMDALRAIGYDKTITAEILPPTGDTVAVTSVALDKIFAL